MSVFISTNSLENATSTSHLHSLPCKIEHNGEAQAKNYFHSSVRTGDEKELTASFRGRPLKGKSTKLPEGFTGYILKEIRRPFVEEEDRNLTVTHKFNDFVYWNLDRVASENDTLHRSLEWSELSKAIHQPVDTEDSQKSLTGK